MEKNNIVDFASRDRISDTLTDLLRTGAQQLISTAVEAELESFLAQFAAERTEAGHAAVVRNGHHPARPFQTGIGPVSVRIPQGSVQRRQTGYVSLCSGATLCAQIQDVGSRLALAVSEGCFQWRNGSGPQGSSGS